MKQLLKKFTLPLAMTLLSTSFSTVASAESLILTSSDISAGEFMPKAQEFIGFGCSGGNQSPALSWSGAPEGTEAFAILVHDPDAPTGSGWWHWQLINIPSEINSLAAGAGDESGKSIPQGSLQIENDYGVAAFGGACPPEGHGVHRYQFTLHALSKKLDLPQDASGALVSYMVRANSIASTTLEALYKR